MKHENEIIWLTDNADKKTKEQMERYLKHAPENNQKIVIMPDCHAGAGSVIGFTSTYEHKIIPNTIGVDIGCGVLAAEFQAQEIDIQELDKELKKEVPRGFNVHRVKQSTVLEGRIRAVAEKRGLKNIDRYLKSLGTLGGGNHFIEIGKDPLDEYKYFIFIHSGSRNFGHNIATYWQKQASLNDDGKTPKDLRSLSLKEKAGREYLSDQRLACDYAYHNRWCLMSIVKRSIEKCSTNIGNLSYWDTVHNYIDTANRIIRKGAISAQEGDLVTIPLNAEDGTIIATGKGNKAFNYSAPHGAGRVGSRRAMKRKGLDIDKIRARMAANGTYSTTIPIDEVKEAYKPAQGIIEEISELVNILCVVKPIYNLKG